MESLDLYSPYVESLKIDFEAVRLQDYKTILKIGIIDNTLFYRIKNIVSEMSN